MGFRRRDTPVYVLGFRHNGTTGFAIRVGQGKAFNILGDEAAASGVQLIVETVIVEVFDERGVADGGG